MKDLSILSSLHGIGLIELNITNPTKSRIMIPAQEKTDINWGTVGSLVKINKNFENTFKIFAFITDRMFIGTPIIGKQNLT